MTAGQNDISGSIEPLASDYHYDEEVFVDGRVAFYLKGMIKGRYLVTAQMDTDEDDLENMIDGLDRTDPSSVFRPSTVNTTSRTMRSCSLPENSILRRPSSS